jgi:hypothetical protein
MSDPKDAPATADLINSYVRPERYNAGMVRPRNPLPLGQQP